MTTDNDRETIEAAERRAYEEVAAQGRQRAFWQAVYERYPQVDPGLLQQTFVTHFHDDLAHLTADKAVEKLGELAGKNTVHGGEAIVMHGGADDGHIADRGVPKTDDEEIPPSLGGVIRQQAEARRAGKPLTAGEPTSLGGLIKARNAARRERRSGAAR